MEGREVFVMVEVKIEIGFPINWVPLMEGRVLTDDRITETDLMFPINWVPLMEGSHGVPPHRIVAYEFPINWVPLMEGSP